MPEYINRDIEGDLRDEMGPKKRKEPPLTPGIDYSNYLSIEEQAAIRRMDRDLFICPFCEEDCECEKINIYEQNIYNRIADLSSNMADLINIRAMQVERNVSTYQTIDVHIQMILQEMKVLGSAATKITPQLIQFLENMEII